MIVLFFVRIIFFLLHFLLPSSTSSSPPSPHSSSSSSSSSSSRVCYAIFMEEGSYTFKYNYVDLRVWFEVSLNIYLIPPNISVKLAYARADIRRFTLFNMQRPIYVLDMFIYHRLLVRHTLNTLKVRYAYVTRSLSIHCSYVCKDLSSIGGVLNLGICAYVKLVIWNVRRITISKMCIVC